MLFNSFDKGLPMELCIVIVVHRKTTTGHIDFGNRNIEIFNIEIDVINFIFSMVRFYNLTFCSILILKSCNK